MVHTGLSDWTNNDFIDAPKCILYCMVLVVVLVVLMVVLGVLVTKNQSLQYKHSLY